MTHKHLLPPALLIGLLLAPVAVLAAESASFLLYDEVPNYAERTAKTSDSFQLNEDGMSWFALPAQSQNFVIVTAPPAQSSASSAVSTVASSSATSVTPTPDGGGRRSRPSSASASFSSRPSVPALSARSASSARSARSTSSRPAPQRPIRPEQPETPATLGPDVRTPWEGLIAERDTFSFFDGSFRSAAPECPVAAPTKTVIVMWLWLLILLLSITVAILTIILWLQHVEATKIHRPLKRRKSKVSVRRSS
jgi:hypothetical protein